MDVKNLYVCGFPSNMTKEELASHFEPFGKIVSSTIMMDEKGESKCVGFMKYDNEESARKAIQGLSGTKLPGSTGPLTVRVAHHRRLTDVPKIKLPTDVGDGHVIFVFNLDFSLTDLVLWQLFSPFGAVLDVKVITDKITGKNKGFGFVTMARYEEAVVAIELLDGYSLNNRTLQVDFKKAKNNQSI